jgi:hypothetical protein
MVVEGSLSAYRGEWDKARDRFERARVLALHTRDIGLELLASSWLAYIAFLESDLDKCADLSCVVIGRHESADPYALFRASAMLTLLLYYVGKVTEGNDWLKFCRRRAEELNDTSVTSAFIFDIAAMKASCRRLDDLRSRAVESDVRLDLLFAKSSKNFDRLGSIHVMSPLHLLLEGQISNLLGAYEDARVQLENALSAENALPSVANAQARLELLWTRSNINHQDLDYEDISAARVDIGMLIDDDDVAVYSKRVAVVCGMLHMKDEMSEFESLSSEALRRHTDLTQRLAEKLQPMIERLATVVAR